MNNAETARCKLSKYGVNITNKDRPSQDKGNKVTYIGKGHIDEVESTL